MSLGELVLQIKGIKAWEGGGVLLCHVSGQCWAQGGEDAAEGHLPTVCNVQKWKHSVRTHCWEVHVDLVRGVK